MLADVQPSGRQMQDWNVVVTVADRFARYHVKRGLTRFGTVATTEFHNVLVMQVADVHALLAALGDMMASDMSLINDISRLMPAEATFDFSTKAEFEQKARAVILGWADRMGGKTFHIRLHRRGMGDQLSSLSQEKELDTALLDKLIEAGHPGRIAFDDPDLVVDIETVGNRAGFSLWTREDLRRYPFLRVD
jgi:tRNA(Ser,Leu) C12 N-acetylase TAN1